MANRLEEPLSPGEGILTSEEPWQKVAPLAIRRGGNRNQRGSICAAEPSVDQQPIEKGERILHSALFDLTQGLLIVPERGDIPLLLGGRRRNVGNAALVAVQDFADTRVQAVNILVELELAALVDQVRCTIGCLTRLKVFSGSPTIAPICRESGVGPFIVSDSITSPNLVGSCTRMQPWLKARLS
jgi:hypothetical protein